VHSHSHPHHHGHSHEARAERGARASEVSHAPRRTPGRARERNKLLAILGLSLAVAALEAFGGWYTHSLALISDAGHVLTDGSAIGLSLLAMWFGARPANERKTFGYYRMEILAALLNGLALIGISAAIAWEAYQRIGHPKEVDVLPMLGVAVCGLVANGTGALLLQGADNLNTRGVLLHLLGDLLASAGVAVGALVMWQTHWWRADPLISIGVSVIILFGAFNLVREAVDVLLEATPAHLDTQAIVESMKRVPEVVAVHDLHVWTIATNMYALSAHVVIARAKCAESDDILRAVKSVVADQFHIDHTTLQIESDSYSHVGEHEPDHDSDEEHDHEHDHVHA
jgi:cobalt-zinc-cadmium efflux system protein